MSIGPYVSKDDLKRALALEYVCAHYGHGVNREGKTRCFFHPDERPSLSLWVGDDGFQRWHCFPCNDGGDVFDLIQRIEGCDFPTAILRAEKLLGAVPPDWKPQAILEPTPEADPESLNLEVLAGQQRAADALNHGWLCVVTKLVPEPTTARQATLARAWDEYIRGTWGWGIDASGSILIPHWAPDGRLTGCKIRRLDSSKLSIDGSRYLYLYGGWRPRRGAIGMITEGETDCVWADYTALREELNLNVYALPRGASADPSAEMLDQLKGLKTIFLCFDADTAGIKATRNWLQALEAAGFKDVRVCRLPLGLDLREARPSLKELLTSAGPPKPAPADINGGSEGFGRLTANGVRQISSWMMTPVAQLAAGEDEALPPGIEVDVVNGIRVQRDTVAIEDMDSLAKFRRWASSRALGFQGSDSDVQAIKELLLAQASIMPETFQTNRIGVHAAPSRYGYAGRTLVLPDGNYVGRLPWRYVPGGGVADVTDHVLLPAARPFNFNLLAWFLNLHEPKIVQPLLAWLVAATRRHEVRNFPMLFMGGSSGVGKTTLANLGCQLLGSRIGAHLGQSTPFTLLTFLASTTTVPVFVDEWTRLSRKETMLTLQATIPLIYEGGTAQRGRADLSMAQYHVTAPVLIAGEDSFQLDRETERMIILRPSRAGQNTQAYENLVGRDLAPFGHHLYSWLVKQNPRQLPAFERGAVTRPEHNRDCLLAGWETLLAFLEDAAQRDDNVPHLPAAPDLTALEEAALDHENAYEAALQEAISLRDGTGSRLVWEDPDGRGTWVRFASLVPIIERAVDIDLPGGHRAMRRYFEERYTVSEHRVQSPLGERVRACLIAGYSIEPETVE